MTDQSGAFPEGLREAPWDSLIDVVTAYVNDRPVISGGDSDRAVILAAIDRLRAALERPRPAPPEPLAHEMFNAELRYKGLEIDVGAKLCALAGFRYDEPYGVDVTFDDYDTSFEFKNTPSTWEPTAEHRAAWWAMGFARAWVCYSDGTETYYAADGTVGNRHAGHAGGSAGTGAAPPDASWSQQGRTSVTLFEQQISDALKELLTPLTHEYGGKAGYYADVIAPRVATAIRVAALADSWGSGSQAAALRELRGGSGSTPQGAK